MANYNDLSYGSRGDEVKKLQQFWSTQGMTLVVQGLTASSVMTP